MKRTFRRVQFFVVLMALSLLFSACSSGKVEPDTIASETEESSAIEETLETVESVEAVSMRLERIEGDVSLTDDGKKLTPMVGQRLHDGNAVGTMVKSRAGISLDDVKIAVLGEESLAELYQDGKKLAMDLDSGEMYFRVAEPLGDDETFEIRTSTMTLGIRGTAGYVRVVDENTTIVILVSGEAVIMTVSGDSQPIEAGQQVIVSIANDDENDNNENASHDGHNVFDVSNVNYNDYPELLKEELQADSEVSLQDIPLTITESQKEVLDQLYSFMNFDDPQEMMDYVMANREAIYTIAEDAISVGKPFYMGDSLKAYEDGSGVFLKQPNIVYTGQMKDGKPGGKGILVHWIWTGNGPYLLAAFTYSSEWDDGLANGYMNTGDCNYNADGSRDTEEGTFVSYQGTAEDDLFNGEVIHTDIDFFSFEEETTTFVFDVDHGHIVLNDKVELFNHTSRTGRITDCRIMSQESTENSHAYIYISSNEDEFDNWCTWDYDRPVPSLMSADSGSESDDEDTSD